MDWLRSEAVDVWGREAAKNSPPRQSGSISKNGAVFG